MQTMNCFCITLNPLLLHNFYGIAQLLEKIIQLRGSEEADTSPVSLDSLDKDGYAAIHYVIMNKKHKKKRDLLELLVINGADVNLTTTCRGGLTAAHLAVLVC